MSPLLAEFLGTALLVALGNGVGAGVSLTKSFAKDAGWIVITFAWGFAVAIAAYAVGQFSGAHLNPAVTLGLAFDGSFAWADVPGYIVAQIAGGILGASLVFVHYLPHWAETKDPATKLGVFATSPAIPHTFANLMSEMIATFLLVIGLLSIGANKFSDGLNPLIVGFLIVSLGMSFGGTTGYAMNPARDLGPRIAHFILPIHGKGSSNWGYSWIPVLGPVLGGSLGGLFYRSVFTGKDTPAFWIVGLVTIVILGLCYRFGVRPNKTTSMKSKSA